jgi:hypothetical protein
MSANPAYYQCATCKACWASREALVQDKRVVVAGYQASFIHPGEGLFLFNHVTSGCRTTFGIKVGEFRSYYNGPQYEIRQTGSENCEGRCLQLHNLSPCNAQCDMRWIRDVMQCLLEHRVPEHIHGKSKRAVQL